MPVRRDEDAQSGGHGHLHRGPDTGPRCRPATGGSAQATWTGAYSAGQSGTITATVWMTAACRWPRSASGSPPAIRRDRPAGPDTVRPVGRSTRPLGEPDRYPPGYRFPGTACPGTPRPGKTGSFVNPASRRPGRRARTGQRRRLPPPAPAPAWPLTRHRILSLRRVRHVSEAQILPSKFQCGLADRLEWRAF